MRSVLRFARKLWRDRRGGTAIEYGMILGLVVVVLIVSLKLLAGTTTDMWAHVSEKVIQNGPRP
ncbi:MULTISPECIES: Flp family type IVb pilin [unclassified Sphingomonas]|uniref:Flp family type IVb pilin n=1 Tax=unclassified Sphingomonas TaxID=196159 RepID=UPI0006F6D7B5|nr:MULTISPECIES: Flp family type IVb pilin [unclassified Sphingomonas]KQM98140.1 hypothetical protein ASE78_07730 [Sphingomonas sp. Leaf25]KQN37670.1 hypothetical protein ASE97_08940 [Sphingomonas sp. Leaf42]KQT28037.1 hypothetical protein ASG37_11650 [Sphingomonas sp. Leaf407]